MPKYSRVTKFQPIIEEKIDEGWSKIKIYEHLKNNYTANFTYRNLLTYMDRMKKRRAVVKEHFERSETELAQTATAFNNNAQAHIATLNGQMHKYHTMIEEVIQDRALLEGSDFNILDFEENMKQLMAVAFLGANKYAPGKDRFDVETFERLSTLYINIAKTYNLILSDTNLVNPYTLNLSFNVKDDGKEVAKPLAEIEKEVEDDDDGLAIIDVDAEVQDIDDKEFQEIWKKTQNKIKK